MGFFVTMRGHSIGRATRALDDYWLPLHWRKDVRPDPLEQHDTQMSIVNFANCYLIQNILCQSLLGLVMLAVGVQLETPCQYATADPVTALVLIYRTRLQIVLTSRLLSQTFAQSDRERSCLR